MLGSIQMLVVYGGFFEAPIPTPTTLVMGMDVSNFQASDLTALIHEHVIEHVVVRLWLPEELPDPQIALDQLHSAVDNGCTVSGYYWGYRGLDPARSVENALALWTLAGVGVIPVLWSDIEVYAGEGCPDQNWTLAACQHAVALGVRAGVYSSDYMIDTYWSSWLPELDQFRWWPANYNYGAHLNVPSKYWSHVDGHQYTSKPIDLDVFSSEVTTP